MLGLVLAFSSPINSSRDELLLTSKRWATCQSKYENDILLNFKIKLVVITFTPLIKLKLIKIKLKSELLNKVGSLRLKCWAKD